MSESHLWQSVVVQALLDATATLPKKKSLEPQHIREARKAQKQALDWLAGDSDFREVCEMAEMNPDFVKEVFDAGKLDRQRLLDSLRNIPLEAAA